jgi:hypothetical protein
MRITCPQCGFFRELPDNKVPVTSTMATCPKCRHRFRFRPENTPSWHQDRRLTDRQGGPAAPSGPEEPSSWRRPGPAAIRDEQPPAAAQPDPLDLPETPPATRPNPPLAPEPEAEPPIETPPLPTRELRRRTDLAAPRPGPAPAETRDAATPAAEPAPPLREETPAPPAPPAIHEPDAAPKDVPAAPEIGENRRDDIPADRDRKPAPPAEPDPEPSDRDHRIGKDGVRDIWARLQAMDDRPSSRGTPDPSDEAEAPDDSPRPTDPIPWERQDIYGFFPGLLLTLRQILLHPAEFFGAMPEGRPRAKALVFNLLISEFLLVIDFLWSLMGLRPKLGDPGHGDLVGAVATNPSLGFLLALLLVPPLLTIGVYLDAWLTHLLLLLFRSAKKNFSETFRVMCYSAAPTVLSAVPVAGQILSPLILVWYMAMQAIGLRQIHQGGYTQILAAVFIKWSLYLFLVLAILQGFSPGG